MIVTRRVQQLFFSPLLLAGFFAVAFFLFAPPANAAGNLTNYAWADNGIGWISFNCSNAGVCGASNYGVTVAQNGTMSGYGWANPNDGSQNHIGWINFNPSGPYPNSSFVPNQSVRMNPGTGEVRGWARAVNYDVAGGWDGWIGFGSGGNYGSGVTVTGCDWSGYGWGGGTNIGWIHFRGSGYGVIGSGDGCAQTFDYSLSNSGDIVVSAGASGSNTITKTLIFGSSRAASLSVSGLPSGASVQNITNDPCNPNCSSGLTIATLASTVVGTYSVTVAGNPLGRTTTFNLIVNSAPLGPSGLSADAGTTLATCNAIVVSWRDNSANEDNFELYRKLSSEPDTAYQKIADPAVNSTSFTDTGAVGGLLRDTIYWYRVRACNAFGCSAYSNADSANNRNPAPSFVWSPPSPSKNTNTDFNASASAIYGGASALEYSWTFADGIPALFSSVSPLAVSRFQVPPEPAQKQVTLRVTDSAGRQCVLAQQVTVRGESTLPKWVEEPPE